MKTSIKALVASVMALTVAAPALAGGKGGIVLEPQVVAEEEVVPATPTLPIAAAVAGAAVIGCVVAGCFDGDDDDDDDSDNESPGTPDTVEAAN